MPVYAYPTCSDRHLRTFFSGFGGADNLLWLTVSGKWLAVPIPVPLSTKRNIERIEYESVNKLKPHKRSVSVYAYPTCSDRHIRTFFFGFSGADNLL